MTQRVILFEGQDKAGKSSIAKELSKVLDIPYFKFNVYKYFNDKKFENATYFDQPYLLEFLKQTKYSAIIDRGYPSEYVYAPIFGRNWDEEFINKLDEEHAKLGTTIVICVKKDTKEKDDVIPTDKFEEIRNRYLQFSMKTKCKTILLDTSSMSLQTQILFLIGHLTKE